MINFACRTLCLACVPWVVEFPCPYWRICNCVGSIEETSDSFYQMWWHIESGTFVHMADKMPSRVVARLARPIPGKLPPTSLAKFTTSRRQ